MIFMILILIIIIISIVTVSHRACGCFSAGAATAMALKVIQTWIMIFMRIVTRNDCGEVNWMNWWIMMLIVDMLYSWVDLMLIRQSNIFAIPPSNFPVNRFRFAESANCTSQDSNHETLRIPAWRIRSFKFSIRNVHTVYMRPRRQRCRCVQISSRMRTKKAREITPRTLRTTVRSSANKKFAWLEFHLLGLMSKIKLHYRLILFLYISTSILHHHKPE